MISAGVAVAVCLILSSHLQDGTRGGKWVALEEEEPSPEEVTNVVCPPRRDITPTDVHTVTCRLTKDDCIVCPLRRHITPTL